MTKQSEKKKNEADLHASVRNVIEKFGHKVPSKESPSTLKALLAAAVVGDEKALEQRLGEIERGEGAQARAKAAELALSCNLLVGLEGSVPKKLIEEVAGNGLGFYLHLAASVGKALDLDVLMKDVKLSKKEAVELCATAARGIAYRDEYTKRHQETINGLNDYRRGTQILFQEERAEECLETLRRHGATPTSPGEWKDFANYLLSNIGTASVSATFGLSESIPFEKLIEMGMDPKTEGLGKTILETPRRFAHDESGMLARVKGLASVGVNFGEKGCFSKARGWDIREFIQKEGAQPSEIISEVLNLTRSMKLQEWEKKVAERMIGEAVTKDPRVLEFRDKSWDRIYGSEVGLCSRLLSSPFNLKGKANDSTRNGISALATASEWKSRRITEEVISLSEDGKPLDKLIEFGFAKPSEDFLKTKWGTLERNCLIKVLEWSRPSTEVLTSVLTELVTEQRSKGSEMVKTMNLCKTLVEMGAETEVKNVGNLLSFALKEMEAADFARTIKDRYLGTAVGMAMGGAQLPDDCGVSPETLTVFAMELNARLKPAKPKSTKTEGGRSKAPSKKAKP